MDIDMDRIQRELRAKDIKRDFRHKQIEDLHQSWLRQDIKDLEIQQHMHDLQLREPPALLSRDPVVDLTKINRQRQAEDFKWQRRREKEKQLRDGWMEQDLKEALDNRLKPFKD
jgi:hypothetical protein